MIQTETHVAVVADNQDPDNTFKIKVKCAAILGSEDVVLNVWVKPKFPWGFIFVPDVGEQVEIEVPSRSDTDEVPGQAFLDNPDIRWTGTRFQGPEAYHEMFTSENYGKRRGFVTPGGHVLMFDDTEGKKKINLMWHSADDNHALFSMNEDGSVVLANKNGSQVYLNAKDGELAIIDEHGNLFATDSTGVKIIDKGGNMFTMAGTTVQVLSQGGVTISCKDAVLDAGKVQLGGQPAVESVIKGLALQTAMATWIAALVTAMGTNTPPPSGMAAFATATATFLAQFTAAQSLKSFTL